MSKLVQILNASEDESVETNLSFACISLASYADEDNIESLMSDTDLLPLLVRLQDSLIETISVQASTCLDHVAHIRTSLMLNVSSLSPGESTVCLILSIAMTTAPFRSRKSYMEV